MDARIRSLKALRLVPIIGALLLTAAWLCGCTSRSKSQARARAAFEAGQLQALTDVAKRQNGITFIGPVMTPVVPWQQALTLGQAVAAAGWNDKGEPRLIVFTRNGESVEMNPAQLLEATDFPVDPGDRVEMFP
jgi:hypothetical protein